MLARTNALMALAQLAIFALLWWLVLGPAGGIIALMSLTLASYAALYLLLAGVSFAIAYRYRSPVPPEARLSIAGTVWLLCKETLAWLVTYSVLVPLERWLRPALPDRQATAQTAVLLLHGFLCNAGVWLAMRRALARRGISHVYTLNTEPPLGSITGFSHQAAARIDEIIAATGCQRVILVAHSMGGLVARRMLDLNLHRDRVAGLVTIGTPHHGTVHARLLRSVATTQMNTVTVLETEVPGNAWLAQLNADESEPRPVPITAIYSHHDNIVTPQDSARLACAENIALSGIGHVEMLFSSSVIEPVAARILLWRDAAKAG